MIIVLILAVSCLAARSDGSAYVIYREAVDLSANFSLATNSYGSIVNQSYSWTVWLQLSSNNSLPGANRTIFSLRSHTGPLVSLFLAQGRYIAANITTASATVETLIVSTETPPFNQWFPLALCVSDELKIAWKRSFGYSAASTSWTMTKRPSALISGANFTLEKSSALGYVSLVTLWDVAISDAEIVWMSAPSNMHYVSDDIIGGTAFDFSNFLSLSCPKNNSIMVAIDFAAYGQPIGLFPNFQRNPECNALLALSYIQRLCLGKRTCTVPSDKKYYGDPCPQNTKWVSVKASCSYRTTSGRESSAIAAPSRPASSRSPPAITDRNGLQNGYRVRLNLNLDISSRSQTQNRIDARLAVRHASMILAVDVGRFVLTDLVASNQSSAVMTFTILSGSTPAALADGLSIALAFRGVLQDPDALLRDNNLLHTAPTTSALIEVECVPLMLCPSGEYVCLSESVCQSPGSPMSALASTASVTVGFGAAIIAVMGGLFIWRTYRSRSLLPSMSVKAPISSLTASEKKPCHASPTFDVMGMPGALTEVMEESPPPQGDGADFRLPGSRRRIDSIMDVGTSVNTRTGPVGVASTLSDLEKTFDPID